mmetsp:Transcript_66965/g.139825  ORF Transcript_66965/g.139825 Transcript_66965/m.139825 type:complete len:127 (+) Transcript_66965:1764-2144(+)
MSRIWFLDFIIVRSVVFCHVSRSTVTGGGASSVGAATTAIVAEEPKSAAMAGWLAGLLGNQRRREEEEEEEKRREKSGHPAVASEWVGGGQKAGEERTDRRAMRCVELAMLWQWRQKSTREEEGDP